MSTHQIRYQKRGGAVHVTVSPLADAPVLCGVTGAGGWPFMAAVESDGEVYINLAPVADCDHGGTRDDPAPWRP